MRRRCAAVASMAAVCACLYGCDGKFGRPDDLVAERRLREVERADLEGWSVVPPTTVPTTGPATQPATQPVLREAEAAEIHLSIEEARRAALRHNLALQVALLDPTIEREQITQEEARFESAFNFSANHDVIDDGDRETSSARAGVDIPLYSGGRIELRQPVRIAETGDDDPDRVYTSDFVARFSQPLLRGAGLRYNAQRIRIAHYQYQASQARTKLEVIRLLTEVERLYWGLYAARRALEVTVQEHKLAVEQMERAQRRFGVGVGSEADVANAEAEVARIVTQIITESNDVRERQRELKRLINLPELAMGDETVVVTSTEPTPLRFRFDRDAIVRIALDQRMEMLEEELNIAQQSANVAMARNELLPLVILDYTYDVGGADARGLRGAYAELGERADENHAVGLSVQVPIGNAAARSRLRQALARRLQRLATKESRMQTITKEVLDAVDDLEANWQQILSTRTQVRTANRALNVEINRFKVGENTSRDVLEAQTRLARAAQAEVDAIATYQINQIDLAFATGTTLGASRVAWAPASGNGRRPGDGR